MGELCQSRPRPLAGSLPALDWQNFRQGGALPTGPTIGATFHVPTARADAILATLQENLRLQGAFLFCSNQQQLALVPTSNPYDVIAAICSTGSDWGYTSPAFAIRDLRAIEPDHPFRLIGCERRSIHLEFRPPLGDPADLARRLSAIPATQDAAGLPEPFDLADLTAALRRHARIRVGWE